MPLKVRLPDGFSLPPNLDPTLPVKKVPPFKEFATVTERLDTDIPLKKRVPNFLFLDPPSIMQPREGPTTMPR